MFITPSYAYIPMLYPDSLESKIGFLESVNGFGLMVGPLYGGFICELISYEATFLISIALIGLMLPATMIYLPFNPTRKDSYV